MLPSVACQGGIPPPGDWAGGVAGPCLRAHPAPSVGPHCRGGRQADRAALARPAPRAAHPVSPFHTARHAAARRLLCHGVSLGAAAAAGGVRLRVDNLRPGAALPGGVDAVDRPPAPAARRFHPQAGWGLHLAPLVDTAQHRRLCTFLRVSRQSQHQTDVPTGTHHVYIFHTHRRARPRQLHAGADLACRHPCDVSAIARSADQLPGAATRPAGGGLWPRGGCMPSAAGTA
mmetsp:Transcript_44716/g.113158  ORF Transcript_44716/g.113158 Transcript_44716/m.113158 type:complete len:231 (+) Transcript_44716:276-968(+)